MEIANGRTELRAVAGLKRIARQQIPNQVRKERTKTVTGAKHHYYPCKTKGCENCRKSIRRDQLEDDFEGLLRSLEPSKGLYQLAKAVFRAIWDRRTAQAADASETLKKDIHKVETEIEALLDRIVESTTSSEIAAYERHIGKLEDGKIFC
ncbi:hypothetical protein [Palleronia rufa]|uniref:hypothetical protein n=1 Tax=Palleronia rufa TaxID=1530186 RepID=UPI00055EDB87|nr:hypothetical protein [Palleronia rufa]